MERMAEPNIEEVGQVCIANVIIVGWLGRNKWVSNSVDRCDCIALFCFTRGIIRRYFDNLGHPINCTVEVACRLAHRICLGEVPYHWYRLTREGVTYFGVTRIPRAY